MSTPVIEIKTKVCLFLEPDTARYLKVCVARAGLAGVSELVEGWVKRARAGEAIAAARKEQRAGGV